ncbi:succinylglutamate desuccinylase/aspartoacylase domain-containing protein [Halobaculum magnesiiphilum]|uniref:Succinylglutamate desuccinylase/aspartoacylase family protein n=1 Tax=Halobaculum magnesiiphilum TaxID=1017351 RepID=A0A8T8WDI0_9EURY|nr:succinylglutamate desuccinylase/aspartoacylase family protein [Halobaculum magnesiiphilum]QZP37823.1 succinylglutamate desuccinylase/aspartoacylase family protein [Halobaculum magnesiiphilum]
MRIRQLGTGVPEVAVVAGIHGDEPCGPRAVERLLAADPDVERPVKLIVANEKALEAGVRYTEEDLNRAFPGDPNGDTHESQLAHHLMAELEGCTALALHSTQSTAEPFAVAETVDEIARAIVPHLSVTKLLQTEGLAEGRLIRHPHTIEVECGLQGTDEAAENAYRLVRGFLAATGALPEATPAAPAPSGVTDRESESDAEADAASDGGTAAHVEVFELVDPVPKPAADEYEVFVENFTEVAVGERFAAADGEVFTADTSFYPALMSPYGYADLFGYAADRVGVLDG